jgi:hypothetical protein
MKVNVEEITSTRRYRDLGVEYDLAGEGRCVKISSVQHDNGCGWSEPYMTVDDGGCPLTRRQAQALVEAIGIAWSTWDERFGSDR